MNKTQIIKAEGIVNFKEYRGSKPVAARVLTTDTLYCASYRSDDIRYYQTSATRSSETIREITGYLILTVSTFMMTTAEIEAAAEFVNAFDGTIDDVIKHGRRIDSALPKGVNVRVVNPRDLLAR